MRDRTAAGGRLVTAVVVNDSYKDRQQVRVVKLLPQT
jgi:hypothetical protein